MKYVKFILSKLVYLWSIRHNKGLLIYTLHHYVDIKVSKCLAYRIKERNRKTYQEREILWLESYDGSGQLCHPDVVSWKGFLWLVATPYPYGQEEYENPCLFYGECINKLVAAEENPIALPSKSGHGSHLSDPCLFVHNDMLFCVYRDTIKEKNIVNRIVYKVKEDVNRGWTEERVLMSSDKDGCLSPALVCYRNSMFLYYVSSAGGGKSLHVCRLSSDFETCTDVVCRCDGIPENMGVWHVGINSEGEKLYGLFLLKSDSSEEYHLYKARGEDVNKWTVVEEVVFPEKYPDITPYKSCYLPNGGGVLSWKDASSVWVIAYLEKL